MIFILGVRPLKHVMQRQRNDCVIATAAIVANVPYETAAAHNPVELSKRGLHAREVLRVLKHATGISWRSPEFGWFRPAFRFAETSSLLVLGVRQPWTWRGEWHCIALNDGVVYDPSFKQSCPIEKYERRDWPVLFVFRPGSDSTTGWIYDRLKLLGCALIAFIGVWISVGLVAWVGWAFR